MADGDPVYDATLEFEEAPESHERALVGAVVCVDPSDAVTPGAEVLARVGGIALAVAREGAVRGGGAGWIADYDRFSEPAIAARHAPIAIDGAIRTDVPWPGPPPAPAPPRTGDSAMDGDAMRQWTNADSVAHDIGLAQAMQLGSRRPRAPVTVAVLDRDFSKVESIASRRLAPLQVVDLPGSAAGKPAAGVEPVLGHGAVMAMVIGELCDAAVRCYQLGADIDTTYDYIGATQLAMAIARAAADGADIVLLADNRTVVGAPRHLRRVLRETARAARGGRGVLVVWSSGDRTQTGGGTESYALPADDPCAQPDCLTVAASGEAGEWARRGGTPLSRLGPSIDLAAPGAQIPVAFGGVEALADDTSLASALVAACAAAVLGYDPALSASELRELLCATARRPAAVEPEIAPELEASAGGNAWDRSGHNFKLGHGRVDALRASLAALDPMCAAFVLAGRSDGAAADDEPGLQLAARWYDALAAARSAVADEYRRVWAPRLARLVLGDRDVRRTALWVARHLVELASAPVAEWPAAAHGALVQRVLVALRDACERADTAGAPRAPLAFAEDAERAILAMNGGSIAAIAARLVARK